MIQYVEEGRNPDIYTREFVELTYKNNQHLKGRAEAFGSFRDVLAAEIVGAVPELEGEVARVLGAAGGRGGGEEGREEGLGKDVVVSEN